jgi:hypothetical protein
MDGAARSSGIGRVSRAMNVALSEAEVRCFAPKKASRLARWNLCQTAAAHLVTMTSEGAEEMRQALRNHLIAGRVPRFPFYRASTKG